MTETLSDPPRALITTKVVGVTKVEGNNVARIYRIQDALKQLGDAGHRAVVPVKLVRRPDNEFDKNAIEVHVPPVGHIGWISRMKAADLAPLMDGVPFEDDEGVLFRFTVRAEIVHIEVHPEYPENPGVVITVHTDVC